MGNGSSHCFLPTSPGKAKLIFWGGATQLLPARRPAGEIMFSFPDCVVCHADSFFIGRPLPILALEDELLPGQTYFVLPVDRLSCQDSALTAASFASLSPGPRRPIFAGSGQNNAFAYVKGADGRAVIKVQPEFIINLITEEDTKGMSVCRDREEICSTPELKKHYAQLVGPRDRPWSPRLETIKERCNKNKIKLSPARLSPIKVFRLERK
jgi:PADRE domain